jgi:O-antigen/teichoic acid export membrane protein
MLGLVTIPGIALFSTYFQVRRETAILYKLSVAGNVVTIIYSAFLIYSFGLAGAVIENGASWLTMLLINGYYFAKDGRKRASE